MWLAVRQEQYKTDVPVTEDSQDRMSKTTANGKTGITGIGDKYC